MTANYASVRAVVFDAVGTLIHPSPSAAVVYYEHGRQAGSRLSQDAIADNFAFTINQYPSATRSSEQHERRRWRQIVADVFADVDDTESLFESLWDYFSRARHWAIYDDVVAPLAAISERGFITAIGSNFDDRLHGIAKRLAPLDQLDAIFVSSQLGYAKPSIEFFRTIEHKLQLRPTQLLMVGDDVRNDLDGAANAGWHSLLLSREASMDRDASLQSLQGLIQLLPAK